MKNNILLIVVFVSLFISCTDFLEQPEGSSINKDYVFEDPDRAMGMLYNVYATCIVDGFITGEGGGGFSDAGCVDGLLMGACDEGDQYGPSHRSHQFNVGTWGPQQQEEFNLTRAITGMRNASIFIENADKVPLVNTGTYNWTEEFREQVKAEAKVLRALMHFEAFKRFGGIPIMFQVPTVTIEKVNGVNKAVVTPSGVRNSVKSVVDFIVKSCEEAYPYLMDNNWGTSEFGRVHKGVALALKARTLLYAASPLFNTATPYMQTNGIDSLVCMGTEDLTLWDRAAEANKAVLDWAKSDNCELLNDSQKGFIESYNYATCKALDPSNKEMIYFDRSHTTYSPYTGEKYWNIVRFCCPIYYTWSNVVHAMPMNFLSQFRDVDGEDLIIPKTGSFVEFKKAMKKAEPRFQASIWWPGSKYTETGLMDKVRGADTSYFIYYKLDNNGNLNPTSSGAGNILGPGVPNGLHFKKFLNQTNGNNATLDINWPIFRLAEFYLNYAEALNESPTMRDWEKIRQALNEVRRRGGIKELGADDIGYDEAKKIIRQERAVELYAEEHRFFDVRRWKIAGQEGIMKGEFYTFRLVENQPGKYQVPNDKMTAEERIKNDGYLDYEIVPFENRIWDDKMYLYPFPQDEVNKGLIIQNPGWE